MTTTTNTAKPERGTIILGPAERFRILGRLVTRLIAEDRDTPVTDETWFAMYDHRGYVGAIRLRDSAEIANIVEPMTTTNTAKPERGTVRTIASCEHCWETIERVAGKWAHVSTGETKC